MKKILILLILILTVIFPIAACEETPPPPPEPVVTLTLSTDSLDMVKGEQSAITATLTVDGEITEDSELSFALADNAPSGVVELSVSGQTVTVTALRYGLVKISCTAVYEGEEYGAEISVSVVNERVDLDEVVYIEYGAGDQFTLPSGISGTVTDVRYEGKSVFVLYNRPSRSVAINAIGLPLGTLPNKLAVHAAGKEYLVSAEYIGLIINDADELFSMQDIAYELGDKDSIAPTLEGNFYLGNDIVVPASYSYEMKYTASDWKGGFRGVLDGRGYKIDGLSMGDGQALFHSFLGEGGLRNIAFVNSVKTGNGSFLSYYRDSEFRNVYLHFRKITASSNTYVLQNENHGTSKSMRNVLIVVDELVDGTGKGGAKFSIGKLRWECLRPNQPEYCRALNCAFVCASDYEGVTVSGLSTFPYPSDQHLVYVLPLTEKLSDLSESQNDWDSQYWTVSDGIPTFNFN